MLSLGDNDLFMASLKIEHDELEGRGDAQDFLREIIREIGRGYVKGPGWEYSQGEVEEEEVIEGSTGAGGPSDIEGSTGSDGKTRDKNGEELAVNDYVLAEQGFEDAAGEFHDVHATIIGIEEGVIQLHDFTEKYDLSEYSYEGSELVKAERPVEDGDDEPWKKQHDQGNRTEGETGKDGGKAGGRVVAA